MARSLALISAVLALSPIGLSSAGPADASPPGGDGQCNYVLDPPKVVSVSGTTMVTASLRAGSCTLHAHPEATVCLSVEGADSNGRCAWAGDPNTAVVYYPYRQGATYIVNGKWCTHTLEGSQSAATPEMLCQDISSRRLTL